MENQNLNQQPVESQIPQPQQQVPVQPEQPVITPQQPKTNWLLLSIILGVALISYTGIAYWQNMWPFSPSEEDIVEESPTPTSTAGLSGTILSAGPPRIIFRATDLSVYESSDFTISNLDGSDKSTFSLSIGAYFVVDKDSLIAKSDSGNVRTVWTGDRSGNFTELINFNYQSGIKNIVVSPDKSFVVYVKMINEDSKHYQLWSESIVDKTQTLLLDNLESFGVDQEFTSISPFAFSADGKQVYLRYAQTSTHAFSGFHQSIFVFDLATKQINQISLIEKSSIMVLLLSPDRTKLAFSVYESTDSIFIYDFNKDTTKQFSAVGMVSRISAWSPDSKKLTYYKSSSTSPSINYIDLIDGSTKELGEPINSGLIQLYWANNTDIIYNHTKYGNYGNGQFWKGGINMINIISLQQTVLMTDMALLGVVPEK